MPRCGVPPDPAFTPRPPIPSLRAPSLGTGRGNAAGLGWGAGGGCWGLPPPGDRPSAADSRESGQQVRAGVQMFHEQGWQQTLPWRGGREAWRWRGPHGPGAQQEPEMTAAHPLPQNTKELSLNNDNTVTLNIFTFCKLQGNALAAFTQKHVHHVEGHTFNSVVK